MRSQAARFGIPFGLVMENFINFKMRGHSSAVVRAVNGLFLIKELLVHASGIPG